MSCLLLRTSAWVRVEDRPFCMTEEKWDVSGKADAVRENRSVGRDGKTFSGIWTDLHGVALRAGSDRPTGKKYEALVNAK